MLPAMPPPLRSAGSRPRLATRVPMCDVSLHLRPRFGCLLGLTASYNTTFWFPFAVPGLTVTATAVETVDVIGTGIGAMIGIGIGTGTRRATVTETATAMTTGETTTTDRTDRGTATRSAGVMIVPAVGHEQ